MDEYAEYVRISQKELSRLREKGAVNYTIHIWAKNGANKLQAIYICMQMA